MISLAVRNLIAVLIARAKSELCLRNSKRSTIDLSGNLSSEGLRGFASRPAPARQATRLDEPGCIFNGSACFPPMFEDESHRG